MADQSALVSKAFQTFLIEAPNHAQAWGKMVQELGASRDEVVSAILVGLPAALDAYDSL